MQSLPWRPDRIEVYHTAEAEVGTTRKENLSPETAPARSKNDAKLLCGFSNVFLSLTLSHEVDNRRRRILAAVDVGQVEFSY